MFVSKKRYDTDIAKATSQFKQKDAEIASLRARIAQQEHLTHPSIADEICLAEIESEFSTAGEAAFFHSAEYRADNVQWQHAEQAMWEAAACGAIYHGRQVAATAQLAYFTNGAAVPYHVNDSGQIFTAQVTDPYTGVITLSMHDIPYREIPTGSMEKARDWFIEVVRTPPGRPSSLLLESTCLYLTEFLPK